MRTALGLGLMLIAIGTKPAFAVDDPGVSEVAVPAQTFAPPATDALTPAPASPAASPPTTPLSALPPGGSFAPPPPPPPCPPPIVMNHPRFAPVRDEDLAVDAHKRLTPVRFDVDRPGERWALLGSDSRMLCRLPCTWLVPPDTELRLWRFSGEQGRRGLDLKVPSLDEESTARPLRAMLRKNTGLAAGVAYGGVGGVMAFLGLMIGSAVGAQQVAQSTPVCAGPGYSAYSASACGVGPKAFGPLAGLADTEIGLASGIAAGLLVGTVVYLAWNPMKVVMVPDNP